MSNADDVGEAGPGHVHRAAVRRDGDVIDELVVTLAGLVADHQERGALVRSHLGHALLEVRNDVDLLVLLERRRVQQVDGAVPVVADEHDRPQAGRAARLGAQHVLGRVDERAGDERSRSGGLEAAVGLGGGRHGGRGDDARQRGRREQDGEMSGIALTQGAQKPNPLPSRRASANPAQQIGSGA